jgi:hypothetical protein
LIPKLEAILTANGNPGLGTKKLSPSSAKVAIAIQRDKLTPNVRKISFSVIVKNSLEYFSDNFFLTYASPLKSVYPSI